MLSWRIHFLNRTRLMSYRVVFYEVENEVHWWYIDIARNHI
jgi:hypothetical protein